ncbi:MAG: hypothetical protein V2J20_12065 [Wenzhouxiangella sp.]|jgi:hypothetical protein|nr:hypothetical protein [Wenzhouxiangella sp.]
MPTISLTAKNYRGTYVSFNTTAPVLLEVSWLELMTASLTLGFQKWPEVATTGFPFWFHRMGLGMSATAYLREDSSSWHLDPAYASLDLSEKAAMSYWQGMIFCKIAAARHLDVPWLANVDDMRSKGQLRTSGTTKSRGDLVGRDRADAYHVIEAKGRSQRVEAGLIEHAKDQAAAISSINGSTPSTTSACISKLWKCPIEVLLDDPPTDGDDKIKLSFKEESLWSWYYYGIINYIQENSVRPQQKWWLSKVDKPSGYLWAILSDWPQAPWRFLLAPHFEGSFWAIGLPTRVVETPSAAREYTFSNNNTAHSSDNKSLFVASDHVALLRADF